MANDAQISANLGRAIENYSQILVLLTEIVAGTTQGQPPTAQQIQNVVNGASTSGIPAPKPTYTLDGETYNWMEYQQFVIDKLEQLRKLQIMFAGPFDIRQRALP